MIERDLFKMSHLARMVAHPLRMRIIEALDATHIKSPTELADELEEGLCNVSYHVRVLKDGGAIKLAHVKPVRGAVEHLYKPTPTGRALLPLIDNLEECSSCSS